MVTNGCRGHYGENLVERANTARQGNEHVTLVHHHLLAVAEVIAGNVHVDIVRQAPILLNNLRHNADGEPTSLMGSTGHTLHKALIDSTEDDGMTLTTSPLTQLARQLKILGRKIVVGRAEYANLHNTN